MTYITNDYQGSFHLEDTIETGYTEIKNTNE